MIGLSTQIKMKILLVRQNKATADGTLRDRNEKAAWRKHIAS